MLKSRELFTPAARHALDMRSGHVQLARRIALTSAEPPVEFRVFAAGENDTTKGVFLFDAEAARLVMAEFERHGDVMIDLEHLSLDVEGRNFDPDARGWARLEVRNGELWAVGVTWTEDGAARLRAKTQRFISPTFDIDAEGRITRLVNIAITALPATHGLTPLVAAAQHRKRKTMADQGTGGTGDVGGVNIKDLADFLGITVDPASDPTGFIREITAKLDEIRSKLAGDAPAPDATDPSADPAAADAMATTREVVRLTGAATPALGIKTLVEWQRIVLAHATESAKLAKDRAQLEQTERLSIAAELVACGAETPATSGLGLGKLAPHLATMPLEDLRARRDGLVAASAARSGNGRPAKGSAPGEKIVEVDGESVTLSALEVRAAEQTKGSSLERMARAKLRMSRGTAR